MKTCLILFTLFFLPPGFAAPVETPLPPQRAAAMEKVLAVAAQGRLAESPGWLALLHYKTETLSRRVVSQADDERFFLADNGDTNAQAELVADIRAFFRPKAKHHAQCLFPARWYWLKQQAGLDARYDVPCYRLQVFLDGFDTDYLTLVFPAMYLNNPGSTFGHTFLRFDGDDESILFSQTLNYAAKIDKTDSLPVYVGKGLFGGYRGIFRTRKYFETVQTYSNTENRDIWEYRLALDKAEIRQLARHVWEVKGIDFDYYFFRENCAFRLLALLDAVKPELDLTTGNRFPLYAIPVDTVRALDKRKMIVQRRFRASLATQLKHFYRTQDEAVSEQATALANGNRSLSAILASELTDNEKALVLSQAYTLMQFRGEAKQARAEQLLSARSQLPVTVKPVSDSTIQAEDKLAPPETGHASARFAVGAGRQLGRNYLDLRLRPAFHDLVDSARGYVSGAEINVLDTRLKIFTDTDQWRLESLQFFNIVSLSPVSAWYRPMSWFLDIRVDRTSVTPDNSVQTFLSRGGAGYSVNWQNLTPFVLLTTEWNLAKQYEKGYSLYLGAQAGSLLQTPFGQGLLSIEKENAVAGFELDKTLYRAQWQFNLGNNTALRFNYRKIRYSNFDDNDWSVVLNWYF